jgi:hypothetical protein
VTADPAAPPSLPQAASGDGRRGPPDELAAVDKEFLVGDFGLWDVWGSSDQHSGSLLHSQKRLDRAMYRVATETPRAG